MKLIKKIPVLILTASLTYGCSDGGGGGTAASPNGIYTGTITGGQSLSNSDTLERGIIYNGRSMTLSERQSTSPTGINQFFDTTLTIDNTSLTGNGFRYNNAILLNNIAYIGTFIEGQSASIDFTKSGSSPSNLPDGTFNLTASSALLSKGSASSRLEGTWSGNFGLDFSRSMSLVMDASGNITLGSGDNTPADCAFSGSITPADTAINIYNVNLISDGGSGPFACRLSAGGYTGLAWTEGDTDGTLVFMVADGVQGRAVILTKN